MDDLKEIGFYTLSNARIEQLSPTSPLWRCELLITDACNFKCAYCRGVKDEYKGAITTLDAINLIQMWVKQGLKNIRFSGGEPTIHKSLVDMVKSAKRGGVEHIAISTNGSMPRKIYDTLLLAGVNDFSISLDACCAADGDSMAGGIVGAWDKVVENIRYLSSKTYVTVGVVLTNENINRINDIITFADSLGVADIRIISAAQFNKAPEVCISDEILKRHPILAYRVKNLRDNVSVRGMKEGDNHKCPLVMDDMAVVGGYHFPCIIYLREKGKPIGRVGENMRAERIKWAQEHDTYNDPICRANCLDVCVSYNNTCQKLKGL